MGGLPAGGGTPRQLEEITDHQSKPSLETVAPILDSIPPALASTDLEGTGAAKPVRRCGVCGLESLRGMDMT